MAEYVCEKCGMGVTGMQCAKCGKELEHAHISKDDGTRVGVAKCPDGQTYTYDDQSYPNPKWSGLVGRCP